MRDAPQQGRASAAGCWDPGKRLLKLAPAWGARIGGLGAGLREGAWKECRERKLGWESCGGEGMLGGRGGRSGW